MQLTVAANRVIPHNTHFESDVSTGRYTGTYPHK